MTEPTDDELDAVIAEYQTRIYPQDMHPRFERAIMRAAIAKWGTQPSGVVNWVGLSSHHLLKQEPLGDEFEAVLDKHRSELYAEATPQPTQAQAGAVPLTDEQITAAAKKLAECMDYPWDHMPEQGRAEMRKHAQAVLAAANGSPQPPPTA